MQEGVRGRRPYVLTEKGRVMAGKFILFSEGPKKGLRAESYQEMRQVLKEMEWIIKSALDVPEGEFDAFFSAIGGLKETATGIIQIPNQKLRHQKEKKRK